MEESLRGALHAVYARHHYDVTSLSCCLERQLPLRDPFFQLKRVPHFQVRDDLHPCDAPAYRPIQRLENATPEDLSHRGRAGCRRILVEGDIGTGKTFLCYSLLHQWAETKTRGYASTALQRSNDLSSYKLVIYVDCVRLPVSEFLARCQHHAHKRHICVIACALLLLAPLPNDSRLMQERVYDWLVRNQSETCVIFDNVDATETWVEIIQETAREHHGFGKILICATPGRVSKKNIDALYYCYGLHPEYSTKLNVSRLKRVSASVVERASIPKLLDSSQELLRNPLTLSLLSTYLKELNPRRVPRTQFELIEDVISFAMIGDPCPVSPTRAGYDMLPSSPSSSLMTICETVAFECIETNTNYFCKSKFPSHFWTKHLCDCRLLHEIHDVTKQGNPVVSFTSRCIRDYLASKRVCRYLLSNRDSQHFLHTLVHRRQFHSVVKFSIRHFVKLDRLDMVRVLLEKLLAAEPKRWVNAGNGWVGGNCSSTSRGGGGGAEAFSRGRLCEQKEALSWLRETDFHPDLLEVVAGHFPAILEVSHNEGPPETLRDFVSLVEAAGEKFRVQGMVIFMDGMFLNASVGLDLARALKSLHCLTNLVLCLRCVVDTGFVVRFLCELFEGNDHVINLTLEGPFNSAENLTPLEHKRVREIFQDFSSSSSSSLSSFSSSPLSSSSSSSTALSSLTLEHINYHHRVAYLLSCWPNIFRKLELRKCNLDLTSDKLTDKLAGCRHLTSLVLEHCHVMTSTLEALLQQMCRMHGQMALRTLCLTLLSTGRHFTRADAKKPTFRPSLTLAGCRCLSQFVAESQTLVELGLCHDAIDDVKLHALAEGVARSCCLSSLDLTGNVLGEATCEDLLSVINNTKNLRSLFLHDNCLGAASRTRLVKSTLDRTNLKLSL